ncbi:hypothetical protein BGX28_006238 [Mortierella sp. GBA30]|nr:hypothetical protein BGX28_006238 [Mortierella sp. GBA30]
MTYLQLDTVILELAVMDAPDQEAELSTPGTPTLKGRPTEVFSRSRKPTESFQNTSSKIMVDLTPKPPPAFVIDKNQRARKWGKSSNIFPTLGGEVALPLWTSDQEMLLNEPKPLFVQRQIPLMTGRKDSSLARLAVLNQMDFELNTPERGNTPESDGSPVPSTPPLKKKRVFKRNPGIATGTASSNEAFKKNADLLATKPGVKGTFKRRRADSVNSEENQDEATPTAVSSARSTPAPTTTSSRGVPSQRPRTFPCSFEGCGKSFMDKFHLDRHEARHVTDEIVCGIDGCTKAYNSISTVRRHQSIMHKDKKEEIEAANQRYNSSLIAAGVKLKLKARAASANPVGRKAPHQHQHQHQPLHHSGSTDQPASMESSEPSTRTSSPLVEQRMSSQQDNSEAAVD